MLCSTGPVDSRGYIAADVNNRVGLVPVKYLFPVSQDTLNSVAEAELVSVSSSMLISDSVSMFFAETLKQTHSGHILLTSCF